MSIARLAPIAAVGLLVTACADPLAPTASSMSADVGAPEITASILSPTAGICGTYVVAYSPQLPGADSTIAPIPLLTAVNTGGCTGG